MYIIARKSRVNAGHGDSADIVTLVFRNVYSNLERDACPAFYDLEAARKYINDNNMWGVVPFELKVI